MSTGNIVVNARKEPDEELNDLFEALAHPCRRTVIDVLEANAPVGLEELAERVAETNGSQSVSDAEITLVHCHLPRLDDAGVVDYDRDEQLCRVNDARVVRSILAAARNEE